MKINFIGGFFPENKLSEYVENSNGEVHYAANSLQQSIISGLERFDNVDLLLITAPFLENYPSYNKIFIKGEKTDTCHIAPFINLKLIDTFSKTYSLRRIIKSEVPNNPNDEAILIYGMFDYFLKSIPEDYKNKVCLVIPDLPRMMGGDLTKVKVKLYIKYIENVIKRHLHKVDCFVFISKHMKDFISIEDRPWIVVEGIYNNLQKIEPQQKELNTTILYTGTLDKRYGILDLLKAFSLVSDANFRLWICGEGAGKEDVKLSALKDDRIKYYGQIPNEEVLKLQRRATILINPRKNDKEYTRFSFPSKTMEYLASGTPTIMYKLDGVPEEYYDYFFSPKDNSVESLKNIILEVADFSQVKRYAFGMKAQEFVLQNKNPKIQVGKILEMINQI